MPSWKKLISSGSNAHLNAVTASSDIIISQDSKKLMLGADNDLEIYHNGSHSYIDQTGTGNLYIRNTTDDKAIFIQTDDGSGGVTDYVKFSGNENLIRTYKAMRFHDSVIAQFGDGADLKIQHNGTNSFIDNEVGTLFIRQKLDDGDLILQSDDGSGGLTDYIKLDGSAKDIDISVPTNIDGAVTITEGSGTNTVLNLNGAAATYLEKDTGTEFYIAHNVQDKDIIFRVNDGGSNINAIQIDSSNVGRVKLPNDNQYLSIGASGDLYFYHDGSNSIIRNATGDLYLRNDEADKDIIFQTDDGSGGIATYITLDGSASLTKFYIDTKHLDNVKGVFGDNSDLQIYHNGTNDYIDSGGTAMFFRQGTTEKIKFNSAGNIQFNNAQADINTRFGTTGSTNTLFIDGGTDKVGIGTNSPDAKLEVTGGTNSDLFSLEGAGSSFKLIGESGDASSINSISYRLGLRYGSNDNGFIDFYRGPDGATGYLAFGASGVEKMRLDRLGNLGIGTTSPSHELEVAGTGSFAGIVVGGGTFTSASLAAGGSGGGGGSSDITMDGSTANGLLTYGGTDNIDVESNLTFDGTNLDLPDSKKIRLGTSQDIQIYHNGSSGNSNIENYTGGLYVTNYTDDGDIFFRVDDGGNNIITALQIDASETGRVKLPNDGQRLTFGASDDLHIEHSTHSYISNQTGDFYIQNQADDKDIIFRADNGSGGNTAYLTLDGSSTRIKIDQNMEFQDSVALKFGTSDDMRIYHDGSNSYIRQEGTGNLYIRNDIADKDILLQTDDGSGGTATYMTLDGSTVRTDFDKPIEINDSAFIADSSILYFGAGNDLRIQHNGSANYIQAYGGALYIDQTVDDQDIVFRNDDGSGGVTSYLKLDGSAGYTTVQKLIKFEDGVDARFGTSSDLRIRHDGTDSKIDNYTGTLKIRNTLDDADITLETDNGSGGVTPYITLDGSTGDLLLTPPTRTEIQGNLVVEGDLTAQNYIVSSSITYMTQSFSSGSTIFGDSTDDTHQFTGSLNANSSTGSFGELRLPPTGKLILDQSGTDASGTYIAESVNDVVDHYVGGTNMLRLEESGTDYVQVFDNTRLSIGTGKDLQIYHNGTNSIINNTTGALHISQSVSDADILFSVNDGGTLKTALKIDSSEIGNVHLPNWNQALKVGASGNILLYHNSSAAKFVNITGDIEIENQADDKDIILKSDDGSGGTTAYLTLDGSETRIDIHKNTIFEEELFLKDDKDLVLGNGSDLQIRHDNSSGQGWIRNYTDHLVITNNADDHDIIFKADNGSGGTTAYLTLDGSITTTTFNQNARVADSKRMGFGNADDLQIKHDGTNSYIDNDTGIFFIRNTLSNQDIRFTVNDGGVTSNLLTLNSASSRVGIGTTSPQVKLDVVSGSAHIRGVDSEGYVLGLGQHANTPTTPLYKISTFDNTSGGTSGLTSGDHLEIYGTRWGFQNTWARGGQGGAVPVASLYSSAGESRLSIYEALNPSSDATYSERIRLRGNGDSWITNKLGIGTTSPDTTLDIFSSGVNGILLNQQTSDSNTSARLMFKQDDTTFTMYNAGGNLEFRSGGTVGSSSGAAQFRITENSGVRIPNDNDTLALGAGEDLYMYHDGSDSFIRNQTGGLYIDQLTDDGNLVLRCDNGSGGTTAYLTLNGGSTLIDVAKNMRFADNIKSMYGASSDLQIFHNGTNSFGADNYTGHLIFQNRADDSDIIFKTDDGSGGVTAYLTLDGSEARTYANKTIRTPDSVTFEVGNAGDGAFFHNGTNTFLTNSTGGFYIDQYVDDGSIYFRTDDGSGGTTPYITLRGDLSKVVLHQDTILAATKKFYLDGGSHTYISEDIDDRLRFFVGGAEMFRLNEINDFASFFTDVAMASGDKLYFDGGSNTYIDEPSGDQLRLVAGGTEILKGYAGGAIDIYGGNINRSIELGANRTGDAASYIDFIGDTTYTDYGFRVIRNSGANAVTQLLHRGTGELQLTTQESGPIRFRTGGSDALMINTSQNVGLKATGKLFFDGVDGGGDTYIHEPSANQIGIVTGGNTRVLVQGHKTYINSTGANGLVINNDEGTTTNSGRIFFEGNTTGVIMQEYDDLSFRTGGTAGSSSGTERFRVNTSGASVVGDLNVSGNSFLQYGLVVNEGGHNADFRVESENNANMLKVDASADSVLTAKLIDSATHLGTVGGHGLEGDQLSVTDWANLPVGFGGMMRSANQSYGNPGSNYFYFNKISNRDSGGGWAGIATAYNNNQEFYIGHTTTNSSYATWSKVWTAANDGGGSGLDADTLDGVQGASFLRSDASDSYAGTLTFTSGQLNLSTNDVYLNARVIQNASGGTDDGLYIGYNNANSGTTRILGGGATSGGLAVTGTGYSNVLIVGAPITIRGVQSGTPNTASSRTTFQSNDAIETSSGNQSGLEVWQDTAGADAFMTFHVAGDYAGYFGLDGSTNDLSWGGWSNGNGNKYKIWHAGNTSSFTGDLVSSERNKGVFGTYDSTKTDHIWSMGTAYRNSSTGADFGNLYGLAYKHTNNSTGGNMGGGHQMVWVTNGTPRGSIGEVSIWSKNYFYAAGNYGSSWDTNRNTALTFAATSSGTAYNVLRVDTDNGFKLQTLGGTGGVQRWYTSEANYIQFSGTTITASLSGTATSANNLRDGSNNLVRIDGSNELNFYNSAGNAAALYINHHGSNSEVNLANSGAQVGQTYGVRVPDGSATTPTHSFNSDTNTGMYRLGDDDLGFTAGGSLKYGILNGLNRFYSNVVVGPNTNNSKPYIQYKDGYDTASTPSYSWYYDNGCGIGHPAGSVIAFSTASNERARITNSGLQVHGHIDANNIYIAHGGSDYSPGLIFLGGSDTPGSNGYENAHIAYYDNSGTGTMLFEGKRGSMNWAFNDSDETLFLMANSGDFHAHQDVVAYSNSAASDKKFKENIKTIPYGLEEVLQMNPVEYDWKEKRNKAHDIGVIAQEIEKIIPEVVKESKELNSDETFKSVDYGKMVAVLIKAVQEQQVQIDELKIKLEEKSNG